MADREFIFIAEVPVYVPYQKSKEETILQQAKKLNISNAQKYSTNYNVEYFIADKPDWRGRFKEVNCRSENNNVLNLQNDKQRVSNIQELFKDESFGQTRSESRREVQKRLRLVLLANRMRSIFEAKNDSLRQLPHMTDDICKVISGYWEPKWVTRDNSIVEINEVRKYMKCCLANWRYAKAQADEKSGDYWYKKVEHLLEQEEKVNGRAPYHELREWLRLAPERERFVEPFKAQHPNSILYEATHDSDLVGLRIRSDDDKNFPIGLYSRYLKRLNTCCNLPNVMTTGYRVAYEAERFGDVHTYAFIYQAIEEDRYARAAASAVEPCASYVPEPNCLYLVPPGKIRIPYSFLQLPSKQLHFNQFNSYDPCESLSIISQMGDNFCLLFDPCHPVIMKTPPRMLYYKKNKKTEICGNTYGRYDLINKKYNVFNWKMLYKLSSNLSQSPFSYRDYSITLYRQFGLVGKVHRFDNSQKVARAFDLFKSAIPAIFKYYDPNIKNNDKLEIRWIDNNMSNPNNQVLAYHLNSSIFSHNSIEKQIAALVEQLDKIFNHKIGTRINKIAEAMGKVRQDHFRMFFSDSQEESRTFPWEMIE